MRQINFNRETKNVFLRKNEEKNNNKKKKKNNNNNKSYRSVGHLRTHRQKGGGALPSTENQKKKKKYTSIKRGRARDKSIDRRR
jgi:hypothetical protein